MASGKLTRPVHLVLDYDGTLTVKDTMAVLGDLPKQPKMTWKEIVDAYVTDYIAYKDTPYSWKHYDRLEFSGWLAARKWVEDKSARRVQDADFFKGVTFDEMEISVKKHLSDGTLQMREGWLELFQLFMNSEGSKISILSVNWSETSIRLALLYAARKLDLPEQEQKSLSIFIEHMEIHANEIEGLHAPGGSSGVVCRSDGGDIRTSDDKLRYILEFKKNNALVVYVGDSSTDFDSLCDADFGVWLYDVPEFEREEKFQQVFAPFDKSGFIPPPLASINLLKDGRELFYWSASLQPLTRILSAG